jgi:colanic acid/amylovoran biosynthesis glycosyltransferase
LILILFTASYPFDVATEQTFLNVEIEYLAKNFERVILVPRRCEGAKLAVPHNVNVVDDYYTFLESADKFSVALHIISSPLMYRDLFARPWILFHPPTLVRLLNFLGGAYLTMQWVQNWLKKSNYKTADCIFYTYWFDQGAMGIGLAKDTYPDIKLVSRVHGYDLYEERYSPPYLPCRRAALEAVDALFADADAGLAYLRKQYPGFSSRFDVELVGVKDPGFITASSSDGIFRVVSCSIIRPVKRVDLLLAGIASASRRRPHQQIEWYHFGNGEHENDKDDLQRSATDILPENARAFLQGYSTQQALMEFYCANPIDVFVNVSASEGTPVSSMEAISCGIPMIATGVGGNCEVVTDENGILLSPNPTPDEIADSIFMFLDHPEMAELKRKGSSAVWRAKYNADVNFDSFARRLMAIRTTERMK